MSINLMVSLTVLGAICFYKEINLSSLGAEWTRINKPILVFVVISSAAVHIFVGAHKMWQIMRAMGVDISYGEALRVRLGAGPLRLLTPLKAGELVNILYFWRHKEMPFARASGGVILDKGLNMVGAIYWLLLGLILLPGLSSLSQTLLVAALAVFYIVFFFYVPLHNLTLRIARGVHPRIGRLAEGLLAPFREFSPGKKLYFLVYGLLFNLRPLVVCFLLFSAYKISTDMPQILARTSVAILAGHTPGTLVGMGPRELVLCEMFSGLAPKEIILTVGFLMTLTVHVIPMIIGIPWVSWFLRRLASNNQVIDVVQQVPA
jgi:hypothetical protein